MCKSSPLVTLTFVISIHEHPDEGRRPSGLAAPAPELTSESDASGAESSVPEESPTTATTSEHTPSVASNSEEQKKRNFYPVTWRVVGGGVMMSGRREFITHSVPFGLRLISGNELR